MFGGFLLDLRFPGVLLFNCVYVCFGVLLIVFVYVRLLRFCGVGMFSCLVSLLILGCRFVVSVVLLSLLGFGFGVPGYFGYFPVVCRFGGYFVVLNLCGYVWVLVFVFGSCGCLILWVFVVVDFVILLIGLLGCRFVC